MYTKKSLFITILLILLAFSLFACQGETQPDAAEPADAVSEPVAEPQEDEAADVAVEPEVAVAEEADEGLEIYRVAILSDMTSSNIWNLWGPGASAYNYVVQSAYWPALFTLSDKRFDFIPDVAADFGTPLEQEGDFWTTVIELKPGYLWSDGSEVTANDLIFTSEVVMDFDLSGNWDYGGGELVRIEALDEYTVKFYYTEKPGLAVHQYGVLQNPIVNQAFWEPLVADAYTALESLEGLEPESEEYIAAMVEAQQTLYGIEANAEPIAGPFMFDKWEVGAFIENAANESHSYQDVIVEEYANGAYREYLEGFVDFAAYGDAEGDVELAFVNGPHAGSVIYSVYNQDAAVMALLSDEVDYIYNPNGYGPGLRAQLDGNENVAVQENPRNGFRFMAFNFRTPPLDDIAVRQAITCMIDKEFLTANILQGAAFPVYTPVPEGQAFWYNSEVTRICYGLSEQERMEWAITRLKDAGYTWDVEPTWNEARGGSIDWGEGLMMPSGEYVPELLLLAPSPGYDPLRATSGVLIEQWAGMLGFPVRAQLTNFNNILTETLGGGLNFDMAVVGWSLTMFPDHMCDFFLEEYGGPFAFMAYESEDLSTLCAAFTASTDLLEAQQLSYQMQEVLATELPYTYLFANPVQDAFSVSSIEFPYVSVLDGIEGFYGLPDLVHAPE